MLAAIFPAAASRRGCSIAEATHGRCGRAAARVRGADDTPGRWPGGRTSPSSSRGTRISTRSRHRDALVARREVVVTGRPAAEPVVVQLRGVRQSTDRRGRSLALRGRSPTRSSRASIANTTARSTPACSRDQSAAVQVSTNRPTSRASSSAPDLSATFRDEAPARVVEGARTRRARDRRRRAPSAAAGAPLSAWTAPTLRLPGTSRDARPPAAAGPRLPLAMRVIAAPGLPR